MRIYQLTIIISLILTSCGKKVDSSKKDGIICDKTENSSKCSEFSNGQLMRYYEKNEKDQYHGAYIEYYSSGLIKTEGQYDNGTEVGVFQLYLENGSLERIIQYSANTATPTVLRDFKVYPPPDSSIRHVTEFIWEGKSNYPSKWLRFNNKGQFLPSISDYYCSELTRKNSDYILKVKGSFHDNDSVYFYLFTGDSCKHKWGEIFRMKEISDNQFDLEIKLPININLDTIRGTILPCKQYGEEFWNQGGVAMTYSYIPKRDYYFEKLLFENTKKYWKNVKRSNRL